MSKSSKPRAGAPHHLTCIHSPRGLCPTCQADYAEDPEGYAEFGDHPAGIDRYNALLAELVELGLVAPEGYDDSHIPF